MGEQELQDYDVGPKLLMKACITFWLFSRYLIHYSVLFLLFSPLQTQFPSII